MSAYLDWHVGMKVVFIGGTTNVRITRYFFGLLTKTERFTRLVEGQTYTIAEIGKGRDRVTGDIVIGIGIVSDPDHSPGYYPARLFRRVQEKKADISVFTALLNAQEVLEEVPFQ